MMTVIRSVLVWYNYMTPFIFTMESEGSYRSKNNEKGGQQIQQSRRKLVQNASKLSNDRF